MRVLALNPYHGGSHRAFLDRWVAHSSHTITPLSLPPYHWKWRMRHAAITFADQLRDSPDTFDAVWCTDMLNLAEWRGLVPRAFAALPAVVYFHENQLTYPVQQTDERDLHFAMTNLTTALSADAVWFNSGYHRDTLCEAFEQMLRKMPNHAPTDAVDRIQAKSTVMHPGVEATASASRTEGPLHLVWAARWEHDKNPELFFEALDQLMADGVAFRVSIMGESFQQVPEVFETARSRLGDRVVAWGYQPTREAYERVLGEADVFVSTADHEFFGIAAVEAAAAGCAVIVPHRLAYPEVFADHATYYDGSVGDLVTKLKAAQPGNDTAVRDHVLDRYRWSARAMAMDTAMAAVVDRARID